MNNNKKNKNNENNEPDYTIADVYAYASEHYGGI